jgi:hypothetical protein
VTFFCHPSGSIQLKKEPYMPKVRIAQREGYICAKFCSTFDFSFRL